MFLPAQVGLLATLLGATDLEVAEGLLLYERLKFDRAVVTLGRALAKGIAGDDRISALETLAFAHTVLGDALHAEETFHLLLDERPLHALDSNLSPRLKVAFTEAKGSWIEGRKIAFVLRPDLDRGELLGDLRGGDPRRVGSVLAREESGRASSLDCKGRECRGEAPSSVFHIDVCDRSGGVLHTSGPFERDPAQTGGDAWWWAAVIALALGGGVALSLAIGGGEPPEGSLGRLKLP